MAEQRLDDDAQRQQGHGGGDVDLLMRIGGGLPFIFRAAYFAADDTGERRDARGLKIFLHQLPLSARMRAVAGEQPIAEHHLDERRPAEVLPLHDDLNVPRVCKKKGCPVARGAAHHVPVITQQSAQKGQWIDVCIKRHKLTGYGNQT